MDLVRRIAACPWYRKKTTISYNDILWALRREIAGQEFMAGAVPGPLGQQISDVQQPQALLAA
jgi:hypothetical protein